jgi:hypothetical protein
MERVSLVFILGMIVFIGVFFRMMYIRDSSSKGELSTKDYLIALLWAILVVIIFSVFLLRDS